MEQKRILSLDMSTKTGFALLVSDDSGCYPEEYGQFPNTPEPIGEYPGNYVLWSGILFAQVLDLVDRLHPDHLVIEETASGSRNAYSQKILEFLHFRVAKMIMESNIPCTYVLTEQWRREVGCVMNLEEKNKNKLVRDYKKKTEKKTGTKTKVAYDSNGKRIGLVTRKHVNVRIANEVFGTFFKKPLIMAQEDLADSLLIGYSYHLRRLKNESQIF